MESIQAEEQTKRETGILSVQYNTVREIPPSPEEPVEEAVEGSSGDWKEIPVPDLLRVDVRLTFLCNSLAEAVYAYAWIKICGSHLHSGTPHQTSKHLQDKRTRCSFTPIQNAKAYLLFPHDFFSFGRESQPA